MAGLKDVVIAKEIVPIGSTEVEVVGLSYEAIGTLAEHHPKFGELAKAGTASVPALLALGPEIISAILAAGTGALGDRETEDVARQLCIDDQTRLLAAILRRTMPRGAGPFGDTLMEAATALQGQSPSPASSGGDEKISGTLPVKSKPSSRPDTISIAS